MNERGFLTKTATALQSVRQQRALGIGFDCVSMDGGYGSDHCFIHALDGDGWIGSASKRNFRGAKSDVGNADYQARGWLAWHHHMALVMPTGEPSFTLRIRVCILKEIDRRSARSGCSSRCRCRTRRGHR